MIVSQFAIVTLISLAITLGVATTGSFFRPDAWYERLRKPRGTPPPWVFPLVWTLLYILMAFSAALVYLSPESSWRVAGLIFGYPDLSVFPAPEPACVILVQNRILLLLSVTCRFIMKPDFVVGEDMKPSEALASNRAAIRHVVESHRARNARVFGSVLRGQDTDSSDLDILIDPTPETTLFDIGAIRHELGKLLGVPVDVLTPNALPDNFRATVLAEARPV